MSKIRTLYHPLNHIWLRAKEPLKKKATNGASSRILELGLTERGLEDIGDVTSLQQSSVVKSSLKRGDELLQIHFDGHSITSADELYHTVWETFSDHLSIVSPVSGTPAQNESSTKAMLQSLGEDGIDEDTVLMGIETTQEEWEEIQNQFVEESEYLDIIEEQPRGAFY